MHSVSHHFYTQIFIYISNKNHASYSYTSKRRKNEFLLCLIYPENLICSCVYSIPGEELKKRRVYMSHEEVVYFVVELQS